MRKSREEWRRLVGRWRRSGLTAGAFAAEAGVNRGTLQYWKYALAREAPDAGKQTALSDIVELRSATSSDQRFEIELRGGRRLRVPSSFDGDALKRLLAVLESAA
jgi:hypothetical protein